MPLLQKLPVLIEPQHKIVERLRAEAVRIPQRGLLYRDNKLEFPAGADFRRRFARPLAVQGAFCAAGKAPPRPRLRAA